MKCSAHVRRNVSRAAGIAALVLVCFVAGCRRDMQVQPRYNPYDASNFFGDSRSARPAVPGTIARGQLHLDELLYSGKIDGKDSDVFPFAITRADLDRGRGRYNIYCSPCHDVTGSGRGMIVLRGFPPPPSFHIERLRQAPPGHFFDVMTNGLGVMYSYSARVNPDDRWRIAAYIRALQLSQQATLDDLTHAQQMDLMPGAHSHKL